MASLKLLRLLLCVVRRKSHQLELKLLKIKQDYFLEDQLNQILNKVVEFLDRNNGLTISLSMIVITFLKNK